MSEKDIDPVLAVAWTAEQLAKDPSPIGSDPVAQAAEMVASRASMLAAAEEEVRVAKVEDAYNLKHPNPELEKAFLAEGGAAFTSNSPHVPASDQQRADAYARDHPRDDLDTPSV